MLRNGGAHNQGALWGVLLTGFQFKGENTKVPSGQGVSVCTTQRSSGESAVV